MERTSRDMEYLKKMQQKTLIQNIDTGKLLKSKEN
jgi:hypothetical protein